MPRIARIAENPGQRPKSTFKTHVIPFNSGYTICGAPVLEYEVEQVATEPTCHWCRETVADLAAWLGGAEPDRRRGGRYRHRRSI